MRLDVDLGDTACGRANADTRAEQHNTTAAIRSIIAAGFWPGMVVLWGALPLSRARVGLCQTMLDQQANDDKNDPSKSKRVSPGSCVCPPNGVCRETGAKGTNTAYLIEDIIGQLVKVCVAD